MINITRFINEYLTALGFEEGEYKIKESDDEFGYFISIVVSDRHPRIGSLLGKHKQNFKALEQLVIVIGRLNDKHPYLILNNGKK